MHNCSAPTSSEATGHFLADSHDHVASLLVIHIFSTSHLSTQTIISVTSGAIFRQFYSLVSEPTNAGSLARPRNLLHQRIMYTQVPIYRTSTYYRCHLTEVQGSSACIAVNMQKRLDFSKSLHKVTAACSHPFDLLRPGCGSIQVFSNGLQV